MVAADSIISRGGLMLTNYRATSGTAAANGQDEMLYTQQSVAKDGAGVKLH